MNNHANRGKSFELEILYWLNLYDQKGYGFAQRIETPIIAIKSHIPDLYKIKRLKSTFDFIGFMKGIPFAFDAKEIHSNRFSMKVVKDHQYNFLLKAHKGGAKAFFLIRFAKHDFIKLVTIEEIEALFIRIKSIQYNSNIGINIGRKADFLRFISDVYIGR